MQSSRMRSVLTRGYAHYIHAQESRVAAFWDGAKSFHDGIIHPNDNYNTYEMYIQISSSS